MFCLLKRHFSWGQFSFSNRYIACGTSCLLTHWYPWWYSHRRGWMIIHCSPVSTALRQQWSRSSWWWSALEVQVGLWRPRPAAFHHLHPQQDDFAGLSRGAIWHSSMCWTREHARASWYTSSVWATDQRPATSMPSTFTWDRKLGSSLWEWRWWYTLCRKCPMDKGCEIHTDNFYSSPSLFHFRHEKLVLLPQYEQTISTCWQTCRQKGWRSILP